MGRIVQVSTEAFSFSTSQTLPNPQEVAYHIPQIPEGADAINDVHVDENGIMYVVDRLQGGLYILEMNV